ncbi:MAG: hypothetical protein L0210_08700 [Rhodospirillales bacterium]|nr:hypothetical protein [Rhodospirillales bacterium]
MLLVLPSPAPILALGGLSAMAIAAGSLVRIARREAESKILWDLKSLGTEEPATDALYRIIDSDVVKALGTVEVVGNRLLYELTSPNGRVSDPQIRRQLTIWLGLAGEDLALARDKLKRPSLARGKRI